MVHIEYNDYDIIVDGSILIGPVRESYWQTGEYAYTFSIVIAGINHGTLEEKFDSQSAARAKRQMLLDAIHKAMKR